MRLIESIPNTSLFLQGVRCRKKVSGLLSLLLLLLISATPLLAQNSSLIIGTSYKTLLSTPDERGLLDLLAKELFLRLGIHIELPFLPAERSVIAANTGLHDGELNRIKGLEKNYPNLVRVPESNMTFKFVAFSKNLISDISDWKSLSSYQVGIIKGWKILEENLQEHPNLTFVNSADQLFTQLELEHIDVAVYAELIGIDQLLQMGFSDVKSHHPPLAERDMFMYLHKKHINLVPLVAQHLRQMKMDGSYEKIVNEATAHLR